MRISFICWEHPQRNHRWGVKNNKLFLQVILTTTNLRKSLTGTNPLPNLNVQAPKRLHNTFLFPSMGRRFPSVTFTSFIILLRVLCVDSGNRSWALFNVLWEFSLLQNVSFASSFACLLNGGTSSWTGVVSMVSQGVRFLSFVREMRILQKEQKGTPTPLDSSCDSQHLQLLFPINNLLPASCMFLIPNLLRGPRISKDPHFSRVHGLWFLCLPHPHNSPGYRMSPVAMSYNLPSCSRPNAPSGQRKRLGQSQWSVLRDV